MKVFLRMLSSAYFVGFILHMMDLFGLRLDFAEMNLTWKTWIAFLTIGDFVAAIGLWLLKPWGAVAFQVIAVSQLIAYLGFQDSFGDQSFLVGFHVVTLVLYHFLRIRLNRVEGN